MKLCTCYLPPPQSPPFFIREDECENELAEHGNEREAGAYGKEKSKAKATVSRRRDGTCVLTCVYV